MVQTFDTPITTSDQSVDRVLAAGLPVLLVFQNGGSSPGLEPALRQLARAHAGNLLVVKINVKDSPETSRRFQVNRTPAVITLRGDQVLSKAEGISADELGSHALFLLGRGPKPASPNNQPSWNGPDSERPAPQPTSSAGGGVPVTVTDATFEREVLHADRPVLVDFWAPWCGPCRMTEPVIKKLAHELAGHIKVAKINVDENPMTAQRYSVQSIPTMMIVKNGKIIDRWAGALPEGPLRSRISPWI